ncbi:protein GVQW3-like isoform X3 [Phymastichus coffea]|uniref:protein GVQW3-like isoform X3 n=1 Tax=Phymastichus coffea TaxID=108790 RepID=UPI00273C3E71|nr:protein GVQW3-like isoform X3 [Phymastichus coffea]
MASVSTAVHNWANEFKRGRTLTADEHRSGRPVDVSTPEMINKIHNMMLNDRRIKLREIVETTGVSKGTVISIFHEKMDMRKMSLKWVPRLLSQGRYTKLIRPDDPRVPKIQRYSRLD